MLTAEYDYDLDIAVKREEAFEEGYERGIEQGITQGKTQGEREKSLEDAVLMIKKFGHSVDEVCEALNVDKEEVQAVL